MNYENKFCWTTVVIWMALIFFLSHQPGQESSELSAGITDIIGSLFEVVFQGKLDASNLSFYIRKSAHFLAYFVLSLLVIHSLRKSGLKGYRGFGLALIICVLYAITDEIHQLFIPGRSGDLRDVLIDSAGATVGIGLYLLLSRNR